MGRTRVFRILGSLALVTAIGTSAIASCDLWMTFATAHTCCPRPADQQEAGPSLHSTCCAPDGPTTPLPGASVAFTGSPSQPAPVFLAPVPPVDGMVGYETALPVAARGHATTSLSAVLI